VTHLHEIDSAEEAVDAMEVACRKLVLSLRDLHRAAMRSNAPSASVTDRRELKRCEDAARQCVKEVDAASDEVVFATAWLAGPLPEVPAKEGRKTA